MKLIRGECVINKTSKYFLPIINTQPREVVEQFVRLRNSGGIRGYGVQDYLYNDAKGIPHTVACLFMVVDRNGAFNVNRGAYVNPKRGNDFLQSFLNFIRTQECYVHDYIFDSVARPEQHCVVMYMGEEWHNAYQKLMEGQYSKMYSLDELTRCGFKPTDIEKNGIYYVLTHHSAYFPYFKARLSKQFNLKVSEVEELIQDDGREYDTSFMLKEETFNYKSLNVE